MSIKYSLDDDSKSLAEWYSIDDLKTEEIELEETLLTEDFENLPDWIVTKIRKNNPLKDSILKKGVNLETAIATPFPPGNLTRALLDDPSKVWFLAISSPGSKYYDLYIPGIESTSSHISLNGRWRETSKLGVKSLIELASKVAYVDLNDPGNSARSIRRDRYNLKHSYGQLDRDEARKHAQYPRKTHIQYGTKPNGSRDYDNILSYDIEWITQKGYDKSGYPLDPDKYIKLLNQVGLSNYSIRLERLYSQIESIRNEIVNLMNQFTSEDSLNYRVHGFSRSIFDDIGSLTRDFASVIDDYSRLKSEVEGTIKRFKNTSIPEDELDERIKYHFQYDGTRLSSGIKELKKTIQSLKNPVRINADD